MKLQSNGRPQVAAVQGAGARRDAGTGADAGLAAVRIVRPVSGAIVALDPDIPPSHQRVQLAARAAPGVARQLRWRLDGRALGAGAQLAWMPWPGRHVLQLTDPRGQVLDEVRLEVRGAGVRAPR